MKRTYETTDEQEAALTTIRERSNESVTDEDQKYKDNGAYMGARIQDVLNSYVAQTTSPEDVIEQQRKRIVELEAAVAEKG